MRDGTLLSANLFRPSGIERYPVIISVTPYGRGRLPDRVASFFMRLSGVRFGRVRCSPLTRFESPDPAWWTAQGYAVLQADVRGMHKSEGQAGVLRHQDAEDYFDLIEWAASEPWCTGRVGLLGVSYLAMSQWRVAALHPPHLRAIVPWEGVTDLYRELAFHGGIPETRFVPTWFKVRIRRGRNPRFPLAEDFLADRARHVLDDDYWARKRPILENIEVPALVCASWSDHGLHTRGSVEGFVRMSSRQKWLFTHGRKKWETFYSEEALACQKRFLDHFLRGLENGQDQVPQVRLEVRSAYYQQTVRSEARWPLRSVEPTRLYLDAGEARMRREPVAASTSARYRATRGSEKATFSFRFDQPAELVGGMRLKVWVATSEGDDLDLFVAIRKFDARGREVTFSGYNGYEHDVLAKGWLRVSHRELDESRSEPLRPWHKHARVQKVSPDEIVAAEVEIWPSATFFEAGSLMQVVIQGQDVTPVPAFAHRKLVNRGWHAVFTGGPYDSYLTVPINKPTAAPAEPQAN
jgi:predicted acyl esterase